MEKIDSLESLETPCFILDASELESSVRAYQSALRSHFEKSAVGYSVKTNSTLSAMEIVRNMDVLAEIVSYDEYELVRLCGYDQKHIVYNGPLKSKDTFLDAIQNGAIVNIETKREFEWLRELPVDVEYNVGLRLNINISKVSPEDEACANDNSRFGFSDETSDFANALKSLANMPNVRLSGLHIHRTTHSRSPNFYENSIRYACEVIKKYRLELDYLDVGGGFFGIMDGKPTYQDYSDAFYNALREYDLENLMIIVEPGNALVASCFDFISQVIDVKHVEENLWFVTTDGSRNDIDPFFRKESYFDEEICQKLTPVVHEQVITGCTCLEYDRLFKLTDKPLMSIGDKILYKNVGAYTMCLSPMFIRYVPAIYLLENGEYTLVRRKLTAKDYIEKSVVYE